MNIRRGAARGIAWVAIALVGTPPVAIAQSSRCPGDRARAAGLHVSRWNAPLDRVVRVRLHDLALKDALARLAAMARVRLSYSAEALALDRVVCLDSDSSSLGDAILAIVGDATVVPREVGLDHVALVPSGSGIRAPAPMLDRVVVTGSATGAARREIAVAMDVVEGAQASDRGATAGLAGVLNASVPGMWAWSQSPSGMLTRYASIRGSSSFGANYPKIYLDGVEVANPLVLSELAPATVDRVEVIRGPQGAALYGADAISGVVNIISRNDGGASGGSHVSLQSAGGQSASAFGPDVLAQQHNLVLRGGSSGRSAVVGMTMNRLGGYIPGAASAHLGASAAARLVSSRSILHATARWSADDARAPISPLLADSALYGIDTSASAASFGPVSRSARQYTIGMTARVTTGERWTHSAIVGLDGYRVTGVDDDIAAIPQAADLLSSPSSAGGARGSLRLSSVGGMALGAGVRGSLTLGLEHSLLRDAVDSSGTPAMMRASPGSSGIQRMTSSGILAQSSIAIRDVAYLSAGARVERTRGATSTVSSFLPMAGIAVVRQAGAVSLKVRGAYGKGIRPLRTGVRQVAWGARRGDLSRPGLEPEAQSGIEFGGDINFGDALSFQATRFDQLATGLAQLVTLGADTVVRARPMRRAIGYQWQTVGAISNKGWEFSAAGAHGPLEIQGSYAMVDSRVRRVARGYTGDLRPGDRMLQVPSRTAGLVSRWKSRDWLATVSASRAFDWVNYDRLGLAWAVVNGHHPSAQYMGRWLRSFWDVYDGETRLGATITRRINETLHVSATGENLLGGQTGEPDNVTVLPGRTVLVGARLGF